MTEGTQTVLLVGDRPPQSREIAYAFPNDVTVLFARDANEALRLMHETIPSVVVTEIRSGSAGGYGLLRDMAANERLRDVPRLILLERRQDSWLAAQAGATSYRVMPTTDEELVEEVLALVQKAGISG
jgi:CheY-like chemotaxis protein